MTEQEWLHGDKPIPKWHWIRPHLSERKATLFVCACCSWIWDALNDLRLRDALWVRERQADGLATIEVRLQASQWVNDALVAAATAGGFGTLPAVIAEAVASFGYIPVWMVPGAMD